MVSELYAMLCISVWRWACRKPSWTTMLAVFQGQQMVHQGVDPARAPSSLGIHLRRQWLAPNWYQSRVDGRCTKCDRYTQTGFHLVEDLRRSVSIQHRNISPIKTTIPMIPVEWDNEILQSFVSEFWSVNTKPDYQKFLRQTAGLPVMAVGLIWVLCNGSILPLKIWFQTWGRAGGFIYAYLTCVRCLSNCYEGSCESSRTIASSLSQRWRSLMAVEAGIRSKSRTQLFYVHKKVSFSNRSWRLCRPYTFDSYSVSFRLSGKDYFLADHLAILLYFFASSFRSVPLTTFTSILLLRTPSPIDLWSCCYESVCGTHFSKEQLWVGQCGSWAVLAMSLSPNHRHV